MVIFNLYLSVIKTALDSLEDSPEIDDFSTQEINNENEMKENGIIESQGTYNAREEILQIVEDTRLYVKLLFFNMRNKFKCALFIIQRCM